MLGTDKYNELAPNPALNFERIGRLPCRFVLAIPTDIRVAETLTVATSYPRAFEEFAQNTPFRVKLGPVLKGKVEGAPRLRIADAVYDLCQTGESLAKNGLEVIDEGAQIALGGIWRNSNYMPTSKEFVVDDYIESTRTISARVANLLNGKEAQTYTEKLLASENEQVKKLSSEAGELVREICRPDFDKGRFIGEAADLVYAATVACAAKGIDFTDVFIELAQRNQSRI